MTPDEQQAYAQQVIQSEVAALAQITIDASFSNAVNLILQRTHNGGSVIVSGLGKSGLIGQKIAATFASTGTHSHFLHPTEAMHGDLGRVRSCDVVLLLSYSGNTEELVALGAALRQDDVPIISIVAQQDCDLGHQISNYCLCLGEIEEACHHGLAPTASSTAMLALGDALALTIMKERGFTVEDFKKHHPGGAIGKMLLPITQALRFKAGDNLPLIGLDCTLEQAYAQGEQSAKQSGLRRPGAMIIIDSAGQLAGIFTDGDLRTCLVKHGPKVYHQPIAKHMTASPTTLKETDLVRDAVQIVQEKRFDEIPIIDDQGKPIGLIDVQDLMTLKVIQG